MPKKITHEFVKEQFKKEGYELLSKEYVDVHTKLEYICPKGHKCSTTWTNFQRGRRCPHCANNIKPTIGFIKSEFERERYKFLTIKYKNRHQKLEYICPRGHRYNITWNSWQRGSRCYYCAISEIADKRRLNIRYIEEQFENEDYKLLTDKYENSSQKLEYICPKGHKHSICWNSWQQGKRCAICSYLNRFGSGNPSWRNYSEKDLERISNYEAYVLRLTERNYKRYKSIINPLDLLRSRNNYHLDHIYSVMEGFRNNIPPEIIANPNNLQMLLENINIVKNDRSDISLEKLYNNYNHWEENCK